MQTLLNCLCVFFLFCSSLFLLLGVVGNGLVILTILQNSQLKTVTNLFLLNLAISDLLLGVFCIVSPRCFNLKLLLCYASSSQTFLICIFLLLLGGLIKPQPSLRRQYYIAGSIIPLLLYFLSCAAPTCDLVGGKSLSRSSVHFFTISFLERRSVSYYPTSKVNKCIAFLVYSSVHQNHYQSPWLRRPLLLPSCSFLCGL